MEENTEPKNKLRQKWSINDKQAKNIQWEKNNLLYSLRLTVSILNKWY